MSRLLTKNPIAIRQLMSEAIFSLPEEAEVLTNLVNEQEEPLIFFGENHKNIVFFVRNSSFDYFSGEAEDAFLKTLSALKLTLNDVAVVNLEKTNAVFENIKAHLSPKFCIYCEGEKANFEDAFNVFIEKKEMQVLYTHSFEEMLTATDKKRTFWNAIKEINKLI